jgi:hypothetical protein
MLTKTVAALHNSRTTSRRDSALHVSTQPFTADKVHSYWDTVILQSIALDRWSQVTIYAKPSRCSMVCLMRGSTTSANVAKAFVIGKRSSCR